MPSPKWEDVEQANVNVIASIHTRKSLRETLGLDKFE